MLLINNHPVKILKTKSAAVVLKENGYAVNDYKQSVYVDGAKCGAHSLKRVFVRRDGNCVIEVKDAED